MRRSPITHSAPAALAGVALLVGGIAALLVEGDLRLGASLLGLGIALLVWSWILRRWG